MYNNLRHLLRTYYVISDGDTSVDKKANKVSKGYILLGWMGGKGEGMKSVKWCQMVMRSWETASG